MLLLFGIIRMRHVVWLVLFLLGLHKFLVQDIWTAAMPSNRQSFLRRETLQQLALGLTSRSCAAGHAIQIVGTISLDLGLLDMMMVLANKRSASARTFSRSSQRSTIFAPANCCCCCCCCIHAKMFRAEAGIVDHQTNEYPKKRVASSASAS
jgi:hypothetical protein